MHTNAERSASAMSADCQVAGDAISLHRDPQTDEWVFDLSPGLDLLEVARVLSVVQQHALQLLQQQLQNSPQTASSTHGLPPVATCPTSNVAGNQFAQL